MNTITLVMLLVGVGLSGIWTSKVKNQLHVNYFGAVVLAFFHVVFGAIFAKIFAVIDFASFGAFANWRLYGPVFFLPLYYVVISKVLKVKFGIIADIFCISEMIALFIFRISCFVNGCCRGLELASSGIRWPLRELEMALYIILIVVFAPRIEKNKTNGEVYPIFMVIYGAFRFIIEWFREEYVSIGSSVFHTAHIWSIVSVIIGLSIYLEMKQRRNKKRRSK